MSEIETYTRRGEFVRGEPIDIAFYELGEFNACTRRMWFYRSRAEEHIWDARKFWEKENGERHQAKKRK